MAGAAAFMGMAMKAATFIGTWLGVAAACAVNSLIGICMWIGFDFLLNATMEPRASYASAGLWFWAGQMLVNLRRRKELHAEPARESR